MTTTKYIGRKVTIKAGTKVTTQGSTKTRKSDSIVTVREAAPARGGKTRITWISMGYATSALV